MTRSRKSADRTRRLVGGLAITLALAWSATAHLLWQVESRQGKNHAPSVRWVLSALEPSTPLDRAPDSRTPGKETQRSVSQPVAPDGEAPAPCQIRRSFSSDVEVLAALHAPLSAAEPAVSTRPDTQLHSVVRNPDTGPGAPVFRMGPPASLPRPPPSLS